MFIANRHLAAPLNTAASSWLARVLLSFSVLSGAVDRHGKRDNYSRADVSPLVSAMRAYLMREYGDGVPTPAE